MRKVEFPAAHSTDTTWFSVDNDGRLAVFETSEHGGYPTASERGATFIGLYYALWADADDLGVVEYDYDPSHVFALPEAEARADEFGVSMPPWLCGELFEFNSALDEGRLLQLLRDRGYPPDAPFVRFNTATPIWFATSLLEEFEPLGVVRRRRIHTEVCEVFGFYGYGVPSDDVSHAPPYRQVTAPRVPITLARLPPSWREWFLRVEFSMLQFHHSEQLQPFEYFPSHSWVVYWLDSQGERHEIYG